MTKHDLIEKLLEALGLLNDDYEVSYVIDKYLYEIWLENTEWKNQITEGKDDMCTILEILEQRGELKKKEELEHLLAKGVPLEPFQANLMFLGRVYGKTHMDMCKTYLKLLDKIAEGYIDKIRIGFERISDIIPQDEDLRLGRRVKENYLKEFCIFLEKYDEDLYKCISKRTRMEIIFS